MTSHSFELSDNKRRLLRQLLGDDSAAPAAQNGDGDTIPRRPDPSIAPLSHAQERLWFLDQLAPGNPFYNCEVVVPVGAISAAALRRALGTVVRTHDQLRVRFVTTDTGPVQRIADPDRVQVELNLVDLCPLPPAQRKTVAERTVSELTRRPIDLSTGPVFMPSLIRLDPEHHVVVLVVHHIVCDGWSIGLMLRDLWDCYRQEMSGAPSTLPQPPIDYADFATWQRTWLRGERLEHELQYWEEQLAGMSELVLPSPFIRPAVSTYRGAYLPLHLPSSVIQPLRDLARDQGATTFMVLFGAFCALLSRYSGADDVAIGAPIANRHRRELEAVVGFFVNTLVLRVSLAGDPTFREVVDRTRNTSLDAYRHQDMPFEQLVHLLRPERDLSRNPLVQVIAQHFQTTTSPLVGEDRAPGSSPPEVTRGTAKFDLRLDTWEATDGIRGQFEYSLDLFDRDSAVQMLTAYVRLLQAALADPDRPLSSIDLASSAERERVVREFNATNREYDVDGGVHCAVRQHARNRPDATAVDDGGTPLSYAELWEASSAVTAALRARGVPPGSLVGVALDRGAELVVVELGILRAGCAYVPLDRSYPHDRLVMMLDDCQPVAIITERQQASALPAGRHEVLLLDELDGGDLDASEVCIPAEPEQLAYVMYTSGSTGRPKGVRIPHRGISRLVGAPDYVSLGADDTVGFASNVSFDAATFEVWGALANGARLAVIDHDTLLTPRALAARLRDGGVTVLFITTALFTNIIDEVPDAFRTLGTLLIGGSVFDVAAAQRMFATAPPGRFVNVYGPTENTTFSTFHLLTESPDSRRPVPIGRPIANSTCYVLGDDHRPVPIGMPGELWVGGDGVALGYHDRPELTAAAFMPDPFDHRVGRKLYRTGDRARVRVDGEIEFLGRADRQIKVRGFRVELGEVEAAIRAHSHVEDVVVVTGSRPSGDARLIAYVRVADTSGREQAPSASDDVLMSHWHQYYDDVLYAPSVDGDASRHVENAHAAEPDTEDFSGWSSSYTGEAIPVDVMREQVDAIVDQILARRPRRLLDVGSGSGLVAYPVVPHLDRYVGCDFSISSVETLREGLGVVAEECEIRVEQLAAHELDRLDDEEPFDVVVLNSVVQYFPSVDYLEDVLRAAVARTRPGGVVVVGDVRLLPLLRAFHASVAASQASTDVPIEALGRRVVARAEQENELVLAAHCFHEIAARTPDVSAVTVQLKRGRADSELTRFRADVHLEVGGPQPEPLPHPSIPWRAGTDTVDDFANRIRQDVPAAVLRTGVPNARLAADHQLLEAIAGVRSDATVGTVTANAQPSGGVDPEDLRAAIEPLGYDVLITPTPGRETQTMDVLALRRVRDGEEGVAPTVTFPAPARQRGDAPLATDPRRGHFMRQVVPELRTFAAESLPEYMQPSSWVLLNQFPVDANGKIDIGRLPPDDGAALTPLSAHEPPRTELERVLTEVWASVLGLDRVGLRDGFFNELGANSLLATQVVSRLRRRLGVEVPLRALFEHPTVEGLAEAIERHGGANGIADDVPILPDAVGSGQGPGNIDQLSDEDVEAELRRLLAQHDGGGVDP